MFFCRRHYGLPIGRGCRGQINNLIAMRSNFGALVGTFLDLPSGCIQYLSEGMVRFCHFVISVFRVTFKYLILNVCHHFAL